jgi:AraC-like DNA-binding protein
MDHRALLAAIAGGGALLGLFIAALVLRGRGERDAEADGLLALIMALCSLNIAHALFGASSSAPAGTLRAEIVEPFLFLLPPAVSAYARILTGGRRRPRLSDLAHALPFAAAAAVLLSPLGGAIEPPAELRAASIAIWACLVAQGLAYLVPVLALVRRHQAAIAEERSDLAGLDLGWLQWFSSAAVVLYSVCALALAVMLHMPSAMGAIRPAITVVLGAAVFALGYRGLFQRRLVPMEESGGAVEAAPEPVALPKSGPAAAPTKYERVALDPARAYELARRADELMERERLFLEPELDLGMLSERLGAPRNQVSYALNGLRGMSFYDYVNGYRVREAMRMLKDDGPRGRKLLAVALDSGFNSKATFNAVFKKLSGVTPSRFRDSNPR